jgi:hypothetical protein
VPAPASTLTASQAAAVAKLTADSQKLLDQIVQ